MKTPKLVLPLFALLTLPAVAACGDAADDTDPNGLGESDTDGGDSSSGDPSTSITATTGVDPSGSTGDVDPTEASTGGPEAGSTGELDPDGETGETGEPDTDGGTGTGGAQEAPEDGDNPSDPAVYAQFRATAGPPVSVEGPLLNEEPLDVQGLQYADAVSVPGDDQDVVWFHIVPGQNDPTIEVELACDLDSSPLVRASLYDDDGQLVESINCGEGPQNIFLEGASSLDTYAVHVEALDDAGIYAEYTLSIDGFCFQACEYEPYEG